MGLKNRCYTVAVCKKKSNGNDIDQLNFSIIKNGWNYWVADPFPIEVDGKLYIFGEMYEYSTLKGAICYSELTDKGFTKWKKIIEEPYHLSFPNIFVMDNNYYMCPESQAGNVLQLYKCIRFPDLWEKDVIVKNGIKLVDTIFYKKNNTIYGFSCRWNSLKEHNMVLFKISDGSIVFSDKKLETLDFFYSRPAGNVIHDEVNKKNIMVSQICKPLYGSGLIFKEFELDFPFYKEKRIKEVFPSDVKCDVKKNWDGMHTFNVSDNYTVIDLVWSRFSIVEKMYRLFNKIHGRFN